MPSSATSRDTSFETPEPITATVHVEAGSIRLVATGRSDTTVEVRPRDAGKDQDVRVAEQTDVTFLNNLLTVRTPKQRALFGRTGSVDVTVALPMRLARRADRGLGPDPRRGPAGRGPRQDLGGRRTARLHRAPARHRLHAAP